MNILTIFPNFFTVYSMCGTICAENFMPIGRWPESRQSFKYDQYNSVAMVLKG